MYADGLNNLLGSFENEGAAAEKAMEASEEQPAPVSKPKVLAQKKAVVAKKTGSFNFRKAEEANFDEDQDYFDASDV
jgi:hypothetical protein